MSKIKVLVVDDSAVIRKLLSTIIDSQSDMEVVGTASDPYIAREKIKQLSPDVITLDIEMPRMDGITFLRNLMRLRPMPVIMISTLTQAGADITLESLKIGAFDFVAKPRENLGKGIVDYQDEIAEKIRAAFQVNINELERRSKAAKVETAVARKSVSGYAPRSNQIIAIGASTGGTEAIKDVLIGLPENCPPIVIAQHIPPNFSTSYAQRLDSTCSMSVHEAESGQKLLPGNVYIAPGDQHLAVRKGASGLVTALLDTERVNRHKPSVEVLFDSITNLGLKNTVGVLLTGMGADGSHALLRMKELGCHTIIQDQATSVVWGMPGVAHSVGAHCEMKPLGGISRCLLDLTNRHSDQSSISSSA
ncbi:MAG: chemotaxis response regulator protein-glutamate methylesterase [Pseudomonadales bacterium]|nr:chemotaxis response regulator protein-glutamate methylesterase [Pseudomonadales bacterium]